ncbi:hypothetical protein, partial [Sphingomonas sp.]|uniref:hypothetical protein n=1 Tax=Sphingomonas sp. TaxID=28214 RepID=UPI0026112275
RPWTCSISISPMLPDPKKGAVPLGGPKCLQQSRGRRLDETTIRIDETIKHRQNQRHRIAEGLSALTDNILRHTRPVQVCELLLLAAGRAFAVILG